MFRVKLAVTDLICILNYLLINAHVNRISTFITIITNVIFEHHNYLHHSRVYQWFWIFFF